MIEHVQKLIKAGISVMPTGADKAPSGIWKQYQDRIMTSDEARRGFVNGARLAVIGGMVSGNLEITDIDNPNLFQPLMDLIDARNPALATKLYIEKSPNGNHIAYRCASPVSGNTKLAVDVIEVEGLGEWPCPWKDESKKYMARHIGGKWVIEVTAIETRGEGGYCLVAPSTGYSPINGSLLDLPVLTAGEVKIIHTTARTFDQRKYEKFHRQRDYSSNADTPGTEFNKKTSLPDLLMQYGWKPDRRTSAGQGWTRPGKDKGLSGVLLERTGNFYVFSSNAGPLEPDRSYDAFALYTYYEHGGDFKTAARQLAKEGYGSAGTDEKFEWQEPSPLSRKEESLPYPLDELPPKIRDAVGEVTKFVQCPVALTACSALSVVSLVIQGLADVRRASRLEGPTSLYLLAVADSGERKTSVDNFFSKPVSDWEADLALKAEPVLAEWEAVYETWKAEKAGLIEAVKTAAKNGKPTDEFKSKLCDLEKEKPKKPIVPRLIYLDVTPEALAYNLAKNHPVGGILSSEGGSVFGSHGMGKDTIMRNLSAMNCLWEATRLTVDRRTVESFTVKSARLTMSIAVQEETIKNFVDGTNGLARGIGFLARFLLAWPKTTQGQRLFKDPPEHWPNLSKFHQRVSELLNTDLSYNQRGDLATHVLELSPVAKKSWIDFHNDIERELAPGRELAEARDVASKAADNAARLAALFHVFENGIAGTVGDAPMRAAGRIVAWHLFEARRFLGEIDTPAETRNAARLDEWIRSYCKCNRIGKVSANTVQKYGPGCTRRKRSLDTALTELIEAGRIRLTTEGRKKYVEVNPALLEG